MIGRRPAEPHDNGEAPAPNTVDSSYPTYVNDAHIIETGTESYRHRTSRTRRRSRRDD